MEKLANHIALQSITEGGMDKKAFNVAQLLRMGRTFALRGKMDRFNKLMDRRAQAAASSILDSNRWKAALAARDKHKQAMDYLLPEDASPYIDKVRSTDKRLMYDPIRIELAGDPEYRDVVDKIAKNDLDNLMAWPTNRRNIALGSTPLYNSEQLATFSRALKQLDPELHKKVLTTGSF